VETQHAPQAVDRPRFRSDLVAQPFEEEGVRYVDVTDPNSGSTFRFYDVEYSIACAMDGDRDLSGLAEWVRLELGIDTSLEELTSVVATLAELGYLEAVALGEGSGGFVDGEAAAESGLAGGNGVHDDRAETAPIDRGDPGAGDALELGPPGASPLGQESTTPLSESNALELGAPGAGQSLTEEETAALDASFESEALELGAPGAVPPLADASYEGAVSDGQDSTDYAEAPADASLSEGTEEAALSESPDAALPLATEPADAEPPPPPDEPVDAAPLLDPMSLAPARRTEDEMSFAGLLEDEGASSSMRETQELNPDDLEEGSAPHPLPDDGGALTPTVPPPLPLVTARDAAGRSELGGDEPTQLPGAVPGGLATSAEDLEDEEVGVDLSAHLSLDKHEVNEAVRASKVFMVPEIPKDLMAELDAPSFDPVAKERAEAEAGLDALVQRATTPLPVPTAALSDAPASVIPLPAQPPSLARAVEPSKAVPGPRKQGSNLFAWVILGLALLVLLAGVVIFWVLQKPAGVRYAAPPREAPAHAPDRALPPAATGLPGAPVSKPPAALPSALLELGAGSGTDVKASIDGRVAWIVFDDQDVAAGDPVAKLQGFQKWEKELAGVTDRLHFYEGQLAKATEAGNAGAVTAATNKVAEKQRLIDEARAKLAPLVLVSPTAGKAQMLVGASSAVKAGDSVVRITGGKPALHAVFDTQAAASYARETSCVVADKASPDKQLSCVVAKVEGSRVTVRLVSGAAAKAGDAVVLLPAKK
jgi:hypothetical protein